MDELPLFAGASRPLRASALHQLTKCPLRVALEFLSEYPNESGEAADTGSLVHAGVSEWHDSKDLKKAIAAMSVVASKFPKGDQEDATKTLKLYVADPRNQKAEIILSEKEIAFTLPEDLGDEFGPIYVKGRIDQVRRENGVLYLWDLKTGKRLSGYEMLHEHAMQLSAYCLGASKHLQQCVQPGGIIRTWGYRVRGAPKPETEPPGVFFQCPWELKDCSKVLQSVSRIVHQVRRGEVSPHPGEHCSYCVVDGLSSCLEKV